MAYCPICFEGDEEEELQEPEEKAVPRASDDKDGNNDDRGAARGADPTPTTMTTATTTPKAKARFLVRGKYCSHGFCKPCIERVLLVSTSSSSTSALSPTLAYRREPFGLGVSAQEFLAAQQQTSNGNNNNIPSPARHPSNVVIAGVPTQGSCPLCRARLSIFDLKWVVDEPKPDDNQDEKKTETKEKPPAKGKKTKKKEKESAVKADPDQYAYHDEIVTDWKQTPLLGKIYTNVKGIGASSFHFTERKAYVNVQEILRETGNPNRVPSPSLTLREFQWHHPSKTMRAVIDNVLARNREYEEIIWSFSSNMAFVKTGAQVSHWKTFSTIDALHRTLPLDGTYRTQLVDANGNSPADDDDEYKTTSLSVHIVGHKFVLNDKPYDVRVFPDRGVVFIMCFQQMDQSRQGAWNFALRPEGPRDGESFLCPVSPGLFEKWTMVHKSTRPPPSEVVTLGVSAADPTGMYRLHEAPLPPRIPPTYHGNTLDGNVFCQSDTVGLASYHFTPLPTTPNDADAGGSHNGNQDAEVGALISAYISYESSHVSRWPPLDDGSRPPSRVAFRDATYDASTRTFRGSICWFEDYGATWQHMKRWEYVMIFDTEFTCIVGGNVVGLGASDSEEGREISRYGENLVYTNAALDEYFRRLESADSDTDATPDAGSSSTAPTSTSSASSPDESTSSSSSSLLRPSEAFRQRLQREGASVRTIAAVHKKWVEVSSSVVVL